MSWNPLTQSQDFVTLGGRRTPGLAEVVGAGSPRRWDERESYGVAGALVVYYGLKLSHFSVLVRLITDQDWLDWYAFKPLVDKKPLGRRQGPLDIAHPITAGCGIHSVVVEDVLQPDQIEDGIWQVEIKLIEYRAPVSALAKAEGAEATPADPEDAIIEEDRREVARRATEPTP